MKHCGIDVHSKTSEICVLDEAGEVEMRTTVKTTDAGLRRALGGYDELQIVIEASGESRWVGQCLEAQGFDVLICNPSKVALIAKSTHKSDKRDAETLARLLRADMRLLSPTFKRSDEYQEVLALLRSRRVVVDTRTKLSNSIKGTLKIWGIRVKAKPVALAKALEKTPMPTAVREAIAPMVSLLEETVKTVETYDERVDSVAEGIAEVRHLATIPGIGFKTALYFVALLEDPKRFWGFRDVAAFLGLVPRHRASGETEHRGSITKCGDREMRRLLVQAAHLTLRGRDSALKRWGIQVMDRRGKKTAVVAVARKLAILMLRLWSTGEAYRAFPDQPSEAL